MAVERDLARVLAKVNAGDAGAKDELAAIVHDDLRAMARKHLVKDFGHGMGGVTIQPTVLANDTLMKLIKQRQQFDTAGHLFAIASRLMMRVLLDYHRERKAQKRGGGLTRVSLDPGVADSEASQNQVDVEAIEQALAKLAELDARKADVVKYRILWGLSIDEVSKTLNVAHATIERDWAFAKAWLGRELAGQAPVG